MSEQFDVIIAGASFGGLAVASRLRAKVLIIDTHPPGSHQRSACGTFLSVPTTLQLLDSVLQVSDRAVIHAPGVPSYRLEDPLCTLDYRRFCRGLMAQGSAAFLQATVLGLEGGAAASEVVTNRGRFRARYIVDASGWRAVLASSLEPTFVDRCSLSFGLETATSYQAEPFYFWLDRNTMEDGVAWIFPAGDRSRVGLASYRGETVKAARVRQFMRSTGADPSTFHGGFFPHGLRRPTLGTIFLVGDSAGQCLPLTGEGIRPAIYFGQRCGDLLQHAVDGKMSLVEALREYRRFVERFPWFYVFLAAAQRTLPRLRRVPLRKLLHLLELPTVGAWCLRRYVNMMPLEPPLQTAHPLASQQAIFSHASADAQARFSSGAHHEDDEYDEPIPAGS